MVDVELVKHAPPRRAVVTVTAAVAVGSPRAPRGVLAAAAAAIRYAEPTLIPVAAGVWLFNLALILS